MIWRKATVWSASNTLRCVRSYVKMISKSPHPGSFGDGGGKAAAVAAATPNRKADLNDTMLLDVADREKSWGTRAIKGRNDRYLWFSNAEELDQARFRYIAANMAVLPLKLRVSIRQSEKSVHAASAGWKGHGSSMRLEPRTISCHRKIDCELSRLMLLDIPSPWPALRRRCRAQDAQLSPGD